MKTQSAKVIGLWQDVTDEGQWIVSRDTMNQRGEAETTKTIAVYESEDYADAKIHAIDLAQQSDCCVVETDTHQRQTCIYQPEGAINPLAFSAIPNA